ncbi:MAG: shikimate dehydrogenase [Methanoregula sp.]|nr:shikimate dehydrogenase [Methanoregula sp.]
MKRIVLTGFRGTGKTDVGKVLARQLNLPLLDTDARVEMETGRSIPTIFHEDGEERFRAEERNVIASLPPDNVVISTGGGAVLDPKNMEHLRRKSVVILLRADIDAIEPRLAGTPRPALTSLPLREEIAALLDQRRQHYYASADFCVDTSETTPAEAAEKIVRFLNEGHTSEKQRTAAMQFFKTGRIPPRPLRELEKVLTSPDRDPQTRIMGVAGYPCAHSKSPPLFNALFERYGLNYHYTWFEAPAMADIMNIARSIDAKGLSVTIPFKADVMEYVDEVDEHAAQPIGAVNSVVFACGTAIGYNTDWLGVRKPLVHLKGARAVLLGAGGVAAAAAYALVDLDMDLTILNRTPATAKILAARFGCKSADWDTFDGIKPDLVVNATPLGMEPDTRSPLRDEQILPGMTVYDLVYTPPETPLIQAAQKIGCHTILGTEMFIHQAREQFYLNFGIDVPDNVIRELVA